MATCFQKSCCHAFTRVATWSVAQMQLASWKAVRGSHFGLCLTLECLQRASRWANHAITRQQSTDSKIYRIVIQDIVALHLLCSFQHLVFSCCREMRMKDLKTHTHTHRHTHTHTHTRWLPYAMGLRPLRHNHTEIVELRNMNTGTQLQCFWDAFFKITNVPTLKKSNSEKWANSHLRRWTGTNLAKSDSNCKRKEESLLSALHTHADHVDGIPWL